MEQTLYQRYLSLLQQELIPAMGCTEPIALAYAAARLRELLGNDCTDPEQPFVLRVPVEAVTA